MSSTPFPVEHKRQCRVIAATIASYSSCAGAMIPFCLAQVMPPPTAGDSAVSSASSRPSIVGRPQDAERPSVVAARGRRDSFIFGRYPEIDVLLIAMKLRHLCYQRRTHALASAAADNAPPMTDPVEEDRAWSTSVPELLTALLTVMPLPTAVKLLYLIEQFPRRDSREADALAFAIVMMCADVERTLLALSEQLTRQIPSDMPIEIFSTVHFPYSLGS